MMIKIILSMCINFVFQAYGRTIDPNFNSIIPIYTGCEPNEDFSPCLFDCHKFYRCANGYKSTYNCADGTVFDSQLKICAHSPTTLCKNMDNEIDETNMTGYYFNQSKQLGKENLKENTTKSSKIDTELISSTTSDYLSNITFSNIKSVQISSEHQALYENLTQFLFIDTRSIDH
ncbi:hypothetical protein BpHYR1_039492 [Brachionus plicatilis]|uniref:Chitin-binding type-2 domain-containing protein n=1 Tax=Brachionus plicatilis TaxID=10195 RepID=A0A3M7PDC1_BRAPC|nr:hypothetical protein BpHYR1_039492 [Brachionus plicatilis]